MDSVKIIFFDIDGTLVDPQTGLISDKTILALTRLKERGIKICLSTGRAPSEVPDFGPLRFDAYCTYNGSLCYAGSEILHSNPIEEADVAQVIRNAAGIGRPVSVATRNRLAANGWDPDLADYYRLAKLELTVAPDFDAACREDGWRAFRIVGTLDFSLVGVIAKISSLLSESGIPVFVVSTYNTDYVLVKKENEIKALAVFNQAGYRNLNLD
jgi:hypothetical protein